MAKASKPASKPATLVPDKFDPEALYQIRVGKACMAGNVPISPAHAVKLKGRVAETIREHLIEAKAV